MRKKMLSCLLAVCLFIGMAVPALAVYYPSTAESGSAEDITKLVFSQSSYTLKNGEQLRLSEELIAYCGNQKICQDPSLEWSMTDSLTFGFDYSDGTVDCIDNSGTATITVKELVSGKTASCKVVAAKGASESTAGATNFKFDKSSYTVYTEGDKTVMKVSPTPANASFSPKQISVLETAISQALLDSVALGVTMTQGTDEDQNSLLFTIDNASESDIKSTAYTLYLKDFAFPKYDKAGESYTINKTVKIQVKEGVPALKVIKKGSVTVEVGKTVDLADYVAFSSSATYGKVCDYELTYDNDNSTSMDYAVIGEDGHSLLGVAVGKLKAIAYLRDYPNEQAIIPIQVVAANTSGSSDPVDTSKISITPTTGTVQVGSSLNITAKNVPEGADVVWTISDDSKASVNETGTVGKVTALAAGTVKITATVDGEEVGTASITITGSGSSTPTDPVTPPKNPNATQNPQTGDSWFSGLF